MIRAASRGCNDLQSSSWLTQQRHHYQLRRRTLSTNTAINHSLRKAKKSPKPTTRGNFKPSTKPERPPLAPWQEKAISRLTKRNSAAQHTEGTTSWRAKGANADKASGGYRDKGKDVVSDRRFGAVRDSRRPLERGQDADKRGLANRFSFERPRRGRPWEDDGEKWDGEKELAKPSMRYQGSGFSGSSTVDLEPAAEKSTSSHPLPSRFGGRQPEVIGSWHNKREDAFTRQDTSERKPTRSKYEPREEATTGIRAILEKLSQGKRPSFEAAEEEDEAWGGDSHVPISVPYSTSASKFVYGKYATVAALKSGRRKFYKLYLHPRAKGPDDDGENYASIKLLAAAVGVPTVEVGNDWLPRLDKMSGGRPHNGCILEASPLPRLPVDSLRPASTRESFFEVNVGHQSNEEVAINGSNPQIKYNGKGWRHPFVLLLDGIRDPGNLGAIVRSAYFLGVDAIAISTRTSAPLTPAALKASAGAAEAAQFLAITDPRSFVENSTGWQFYATAAPYNKGGPRGSKPILSRNLSSPLVDGPCVLMLGGEGQGLSRPLQHLANHSITIAGARSEKEFSESLNVSAAAALLVDAFLRKPYSGRKGSAEGDEERIF